MGEPPEAGRPVTDHLDADVITDSPAVRLELQGRPQTLTIVRGMLGGIAELLSIEPELLDDLKTAVSEACNNVVLHAYEGEPGPMSVRVFVAPDRIAVTVCDEGIGIEPPAGSGDREDGIGMSVIRALTDQARFLASAGGGTEVQMAFARRGEPDDRDGWVSATGPDHGWLRREAEQIVVSLSPVALLAGVLGRLARTLAATAHFSLDRFSDVYLVIDTLAAHAASAAAGGRIAARLDASERRLDLSLGPFRPGTGAQLRSQAADRALSPLVLLSDEVSVQPDDADGELLHVVIVDRR